MHVLYACIQIPSPLASNGGGQVAFEYLETLTRLAEVDVVTSVAPGREAWLEPLRNLVGRTIAVPWAPSLPARLARYAKAALGSGSPRPFVNRPFLDAVHAQLARESYGVVQADWTEVAQWVRPPAGVRFVCGAPDVREKLAGRRVSQSENPLDRAWARWRRRRTRREEATLFRRADTVLTLSESDAARVNELAPSARVFPVVYKKASPPTDTGSRDERDPGTLLFVGDYSRRPNRRIAELLLAEILPAIREHHPDVVLRLAGGGANDALRARARGAGVEMTGYLPSLADEYRRATLLVAPVPIGGGIHIKMIEAMSAGLAVLTSPVGNDGLAAEPERSVFLADSPAAMAERASRLLSNPDEIAKVAQEGREHVRQRFGDERALALLGEALGLGASPPGGK